MDKNKLGFVLKRKQQLKDEEPKWHCNGGDCQSFGDISGCLGEENIDNDSINSCPYYLPEI